MSITEVTGRIAQIEARLAQLAPATTSAATGSFRTTLDGALATAAPTATPYAAGSTTGTPGTTPAAADGARVVAEAEKYLGIPYVWGGTDPDRGLDCSGLVQLVYKNLGVDLPRVSRDQATAGQPVASMDQAQPGDLLAFNSPVSHIGIYIGDGKMIHAPRPGAQVRVEDVYDTPTAIRRVIPADGLAGTSAPGAADARPVAGVPYADLFNRAAATHGVDATLLAAIAKQESGYRADAVSSAGAQGLMQLMPATARGLGVSNSFDPAQAVDGAARLMSDLLGRFGRTDLALAAYNAGPGAVLRYDGVPPYRETQNYVRSVMSLAGAA
ncbi:transglycosylase SLT domain-containing protein [Nocardioides pantholopis]|uniref:transglycosylase SLT domain-containing protein n=1 Tax=Nocardioides pantholopis TaxID=2483798 RepID=UPI000FD6F4FC|nr:transglycosylase SLT domain-containing protein [Nocardioides pantholopis]